MFLKIFFAISDTNRTSLKVSVQQWDLPLTINISLNGCQWKTLRIEKTLAQDLLTEDKSWWGKDTDQNISAGFLTLLIFAVGWAMGIVLFTTTRTRVSGATAVTYSVKYFDPLKLYSLSGNIFRKWFASYFLFLHEHLIILWFPTVNLIAVMTVLLKSRLHSC